MPKFLHPIAFAACVGLAGCVAAPPSRAPAPISASTPIVQAQPAPQRFVKRTVWEPGAWRQSGADYAWVPGHYVKRAVAVHRWVKGHHEASGTWVPGHWG